MRRVSKYFLYGSVIIGFGPFLIALSSLPLGMLFGCSDGGGSPGTCAIGGASMGEFMYTLAMLHWLTLLTLPIGIVIGMIGLVLYIIARVRA